MVPAKTFGDSPDTYLEPEIVLDLLTLIAREMAFGLHTHLGYA